MTDALKEHLPASMFQAMDLLPKNGQPMVLLTRHSIRELVDSQGFATYDLPLTNVGRHLAFEWGHWLSQNSDLQIAACLSSPIPRCIDTASEMLKGAESSGGVSRVFQSSSIQTSTTETSFVKSNDASQIIIPDTTIQTLPFSIHQQSLLVEPGSFVVDIEQAGPYFMQNGALNFLNKFLNHELPGMKMPLEGAQDILKLLFDHLPQNSNELLLAVSHDTILAALFSVMAGQSKVESKDWPHMMEGAFLWFDGDHFESSMVNWIWRGRHYRFKPKANPNI